MSRLNKEINDIQQEPSQGVEPRVDAPQDNNVYASLEKRLEPQDCGLCMPFEAFLKHFSSFLRLRLLGEDGSLPGGRPCGSQLGHRQAAH